MCANFGVVGIAQPSKQSGSTRATVFPKFGANGLVMAPANAMGFRQTGTCKVATSEPVHLISSSPHAYTLAVGMDFRATVAG